MKRTNSSHYHASYYLLITLGIGIAHFLQAHRCVYPIVSLSTQNTLIMYQKSADEVEVLKYDLSTSEVESLLPSRFRPSHVMALPNDVGFSFIDNGIIRISQFHKRSPKSLEYNDPFYNINSMIWDNSSGHMYISAKQGDSYMLFYCNTQGDVIHKIFHEKSDFLYPQKQGDNLFFINRSIDKSQIRYALSTVKFDDVCDSGEKTICDSNACAHKACGAIQCDNFTPGNRVKESSPANDIKPVLDFGNQPIAFLAMENENSGFVVAHQLPLRSNGNDEVSFSYYHVYRTVDSWHKQLLFNFSLPLDFLTIDGQNRLYEQILPLLPKTIGDYIYYTHATNGILNIFKYHLPSGTSEQVTFSHDKNLHYFCPLKIGNNVYCGHSLPAPVSAYDSLCLKLIV